MKIVNDPGIDRITRDLSGAMWIFARLRKDDNSTATFIHRCFQHEIWREIRLRDKVVICAVLPAVRGRSLSAAGLGRQDPDRKRQSLDVFG